MYYVCKIKPLMKILLYTFCFGMMLFSCVTSNEKSYQNKLATNNEAETPTEISEVQQGALDALTTIQIMLKANQLYATFANQQHKCLPADTSFVISQAEFLVAIKKILASSDKKFPIEQQDSLTAKAVLAQKEYLVKHCYDSSLELLNDSFKHKPKKYGGKWILPNILNRRDIILEW